jgi:hypothetical protein
MSTRRKFLFDCSTTLAALALVPVSSVKLSAMAVGSSGSRLNHAVLAHQVNTLFKVRRADGQVVNLTLLKAPLAPPRRTIGDKPPGDLNHEKFSLVFRGPKDVLLASAIHQFEHRNLGRFEMHIGPVGTPGADGLRYEAVFNQPVSA